MTSRTDQSYGQQGLSLADRLGVWLSQRAIRRHLPARNNLEVLELGCGYRAAQLIALGPKLKRGVGVDFQIAPELRSLESFTFHEGTIEEAVPKLESESLDVVMLISVLEHLGEPDAVIQAAWRLLRPSGLLLSGSVSVQRSRWTITRCITANAIFGRSWFDLASSRVRFDSGITSSV
jgi:SAM-dependent methyltransferase